MLLTYVDESHSRGLYFLAALLCPDAEANSLAEALDEVVLTAGDDFGGIRAETELHGYDIFQGKNAWERLASKPRARIGIYNNALQAIADHDVKIIVSGVDLARLKRRYGSGHDHPHSIVLTHLLERVDEYAVRHDERALIIADECDGQEQYRRELRHYRTFGTWGYKARKITTVVDTMHFASSEASRLLQAADLVAFLYHRIQSGADTDARAKRANERLWARVEHKVVHQRTWWP
ncbi:DUF3800 domain-containing protein [Streptomyces sp. NBC_00038]|uniref:DUF3800 domain-containing protein n=1 Tax=Streptomyces sp. NBC_00038 TaxID=2903615 RepID=UPI0022539C37|nr:DUF3800 domain-containing protein [Streptomyces sp. NBC_00038]MCX5561113.1 DUF3800 domain-containing protein [Streptomyces sp. NBC_00038]